MLNAVVFAERCWMCWLLLGVLSGAVVVSDAGLGTVLGVRNVFGCAERCWVYCWVLGVLPGVPSGAGCACPVNIYWCLVN